MSHKNTHTHTKQQKTKRRKILQRTEWVCCSCRSGACWCATCSPQEWFWGLCRPWPWWCTPLSLKWGRGMTDERVYWGGGRRGQWKTERERKHGRQRMAWSKSSFQHAVSQSDRQTDRQRVRRSLRCGVGPLIWSCRPDSSNALWIIRKMIRTPSVWLYNKPPPPHTHTQKM